MDKNEIASVAYRYVSSGGNRGRGKKGENSVTKIGNQSARLLGCDQEWSAGPVLCFPWWSIQRWVL